MKTSKDYSILLLLLAVFGYGVSFVFGFANMIAETVVAEAGKTTPRPFSPYLIFTCLMLACVFMVLWVWLSEKQDKGD